MRSLFLLAALSGPLTAETLHLTSTSERSRYGLLVAAPKAGCPAVRYVLSNSAGVLGCSPLLRSGERAVVRLRASFAPGDHPVDVDSRGCGSGPAEVRRVTLGKASPDHSWRAARTLAGG